MGRSLSLSLCSGRRIVLMRTPAPWHFFGKAIFIARGRVGWHLWCGRYSIFVTRRTG